LVSLASSGWAFTQRTIVPPKFVGRVALVNDKTRTCALIELFARAAMVAKRLECAAFRRCPAPREHQLLTKAPEYGALQTLRYSGRLSEIGAPGRTQSRRRISPGTGRTRLAGVFTL